MKKGVTSNLVMGCVPALMALLATGVFAQTDIQTLKPAFSGNSRARSLQQIAQERARAFGKQNSGDRRGAAKINIKPPSSRFRVFKQHKHLFQIEYPENWRVYESVNGVTLAPKGGFVGTGGEGKDLICGASINYYDPFEGADRILDRDGSENSPAKADSSEGLANLTRATRELVSELLMTHPNLQTALHQGEGERTNGEAIPSAVLIGFSSVTQQRGMVTVFTRELPDGRVIYGLFIAPEQNYTALAETFDRMMSSLEANDETANR
jgi:hypothetical protein